MWVVSLPVAVVMIVVGWTQVARHGHTDVDVFFVCWTVAIVAIVAWNFRTLWLGRDRRAVAMQQAIDARGSAR